MKKELSIEGVMRSYEWDIPGVVYTGTRLVGFCRKYLKYVGSDGFVTYLSQEFLPHAVTRKIGSAWYSGQGLDLEFRWPSPDEAPEIDELGFRLEPEPRFIFHDRSYGVFPPSLRSEMFDTIEDIARELEDVYKMVPSKDSERLLELIYPREEYATPAGIAALVSI